MKIGDEFTMTTGCDNHAWCIGFDLTATVTGTEAGPIVRYSVTKCRGGDWVADITENQFAVLSGLARAAAVSQTLGMLDEFCRSNCDDALPSLLRELIEK